MHSSYETGMRPPVIGSCQNHMYEVPSVPELSKWHVAASGIAMLGESPGVAAAGERADDAALHCFWPLKFLHITESIFSSEIKHGVMILAKFLVFFLRQT